MSEHKDAVRDKVGTYYKLRTDQYRSNCEGCGRGYHGHRWQAHHILPGVCFGSLDPFVKDCLGVTDYDINADYSMAGMPTLKAFLLYFRSQKTQAARGEDDAAQLGRWKSIRIYDNQRTLPVTFPGNVPCHQPVSFGHVTYNEDVDAKLEEDIWNKLRKKARKAHPKPENVKSQLVAVKDHFWSDLDSRGKGAGGGGHNGVKDNFLNRSGSAASGWWKPMCMADVPTAPTPPAHWF